jgi:GTP-binding protein
MRVTPKNANALVSLLACLVCRFSHDVSYSSSVCVCVSSCISSNGLQRPRTRSWYNDPIQCTSVIYTGNFIYIIDTADFASEDERIMSMVDGVALVVDATEGPMSQTRFVLTNALSRG